LRILLDHCVRRRLLKSFVPHPTSHTADIGWAQLRNGELLRQANAQYDILVTVDKNMRFQSNLSGMKLRVAVLDVRGNDLQELLRAAEKLLPILDTCPEGAFTVITLET